MFAAYILIDLSIEVDFGETLAAIRGIPGIRQAHLVVGPADCIAYAETASPEAGMETLRAIRAIRGVLRTDTRTAAEL